MDYELTFCENCYQMTNHIGDECQKCKNVTDLEEKLLEIFGRLRFRSGINRDGIFVLAEMYKWDYTQAEIAAMLILLEGEQQIESFYMTELSGNKTWYKLKK
jgi:hypothetical protein